MNNALRDDSEALIHPQVLTHRATVPALEELLTQAIPVLDHGFIRVVDYMGDDSAIVQAARVSYGKGTKHTSQDRGLIFYLMRHRHTTPFEMCDIKFHIKLPIFVARQWIRHRTASVNEYSARYSIMGREFYMPAPAQLAPQSTTNRQGRGETLGPEEAARVLTLLKEDSLLTYEHYRELLNEEETGETVDPTRLGLTRELARMNLTLNYYTEWYWKINLHNLLHFLHLRADKHAQYEIRVYAESMLDIVRRWVPMAFEAFTEYCLEGVHVSRTARKVLNKLLLRETVTQESSGLSQREWAEFVAQFELDPILKAQGGGSD